MRDRNRERGERERMHITKFCCRIIEREREREREREGDTWVEKTVSGLTKTVAVFFSR